ncbi:MAG: hypothetical protein CVV42_15745 [Candidatus Riflebacteria bacterium HGW-Riflebacteria-2]|jgi:positive regulator of sigma E activity|nr:MAG: hypothetical protein CVV42_15745 [Candidatus Riflebacteria bacterium HGW-Riflebacteria-2]
MSLQGKVKAVEEGFATIEVEPRPECQGCHACTGLLDGEKRSTKKEIRVKTENFAVSIGDEVLVDLHPGEGTVAALLIFGLPIAGFIVGMALTPWLCQLIGSETTDLWRLISGSAGMALAFALVAIAARTRQAEKLSLKIVEVIKTESQDSKEKSAE